MWGIIPAAGSGSRIQPLAFSKELLPVGSRIKGDQERPRAVSEYLVERMIAAGATRLCFVISPGKTDILEYYGERLWGADIAYVAQPAPGGLCDAVFRAIPFVRSDEQVLIGLPDTIWTPDDGFAQLPCHQLSFLLFAVENPELFDAVITRPDGVVTRIEVKQKNARSNWIWGAVRMPGVVFHALYQLWQRPERRDEYLGSLVNAYIAEGGQAVGVKVGEAYVDVGTLHGYRKAIRLLADDAPSTSPRIGKAARMIGTRHSLLDDTQRLGQRIQELGPWFHNLCLGGIATAPDHFLGDYPQVKYERFRTTLPADMSGLTVLDIGCNAGFYSLEMKRRGAARVLGIDTDEHYLTQARFAAEVSGLDIGFVRMPVWDVASLRERFDLVLFMGVFYHLRHPLLALDLIHEHVAKDLFLFQSMQRGSDRIAELEQDYEITAPAPFDEPGFPRMHFIEHSYSHDPTNWWIPNRACVEAMLRSAGFHIEAQPEEEVYLCRTRPIQTPADGPHAIYPQR